MKNMTLANIAKACNGVYFGDEDKKECVVEEIITDSRKAKAGSFFIAIPGEKVDGHKFIPSVFEKGAIAVLSEQKLLQAAGPYILVDSSLEAIKAIAEFYRKQLDIKVVGITGSVGKTSTKEMIASVLSQKYKVLKTLGNFNNELGLPLTVFRLREEHEVAVLEMGINHFGEMHRLSKVARPDVCVMTNIGQCHLEFLVDRDGVLRAKSEIFDFIAEDGSIILNGDDDKLSTLKEIKGIIPVFFGVQKEQEVWADEIASCGLKGIRCTIHTKKGSFSVQVPIPGWHMVMNALAGTAVGLKLGLTLEEIQAGIESLESLSGRFHIIENGGLVIVDDCYNANPVSMKASLDVLKDAQGRRVAILGDMGELGDEEELLHAGVGAHAAENEIDLLICVGKLSSFTAKAAMENGGCKEVLQVPTVDSLLECLPSLLKENDTVLIKASHFMHFERVVDALQKI